jgi:hypothetical protein
MKICAMVADYVEKCAHLGFLNLSTLESMTLKILSFVLSVVLANGIVL